MAIDETLAKTFLIPFTNPVHMQNWIDNFLDVKLPLGHIDPDSNSSPIEAMFEAYVTYRDDKCLQVPGYIWLSSRDSGKTLCGSILNLILMIHFKAQISHLAAIKKQSEKSLQYCNTFLRKVRPYLEHFGRKIIGESKTKIQVENEDGSISYIDVIVATLSGGNSEHCPVATYDELDTLSPQGLIGYREAKLIPTRYKGRGPLTIKFSTRKFAFGIFEQEIQDIAKTHETLLRWNIIDITERCEDSRHKPELPKIERYIAKDLPLRNISEAEYIALHDKEKAGFDKITSHAGCEGCQLLPVCKTRLAARSPDDIGGLYKPVDFTIRQFRITSPDMAAAQLMCWKPSQMGLVYPRFEEVGNILSVGNAFEQFSGMQPPPNTTIEDLINFLISKGITFTVGGDWGHAHAQAFLVSAVMPSGDWWIIDSYSVPGLEFSEILALAMRIRDRYKPKMWYMDTSAPMFIKTFKKNGMPCKKFDKDVMGGIESVRTRILDASGRRRLKIIRHDRTELVIDGIKKHHFKLDSMGQPTQDPDDDERWSDICDSLRYSGQNLFSPKGNLHSPTTPIDIIGNAPVDPKQYQDWLAQKVRELTHGQGFEVSGKDNSGSVFWDFGDPSNEDK